MKKKLWMLAVLWLCLTLCAGCAEQPFSQVGSSNPEATPDIANKTYGFDSYRDMIQAFGRYDLNPGNESIREMKEFLGEPYARFVDRVNEDGGFPHPMLRGEPIPYRSEEGFSNITFSVSELYGLPWVWYFPEVATGENFYIKITYLPDGMTDSQTAPTASEVIRTLSPGSANLENLGQHHERIYEQKIQLADREVTALVFAYKTDSRSSTLFVYDDLLVEVRCDLTVWSETWFSSLSFAHIRG